MARKRPFRRLTIKLLGVILLAAMIAVVFSFTVVALGNYLVAQFYCSPARTEQRLKSAATSFRNYVAEYNIGVTEAEKIGLWNQTHPDVKLAISANDAVVNSDRYGAELILVDSGLVFRTEGEGLNSSVVIVNFNGGAYQVQIQEFSEERLYRLVTGTALVMGSILFLLIVVFYHRRVTLTISHLAGQVRQVIQGDLNLEIKPSSNDEIGSLAGDVDAMRLSVLDRLRREEEAWNANSQLITAISHDVRTPLTTLMGFLEILESQPDLPLDKRQAYLSLCLAKARTLRELTGELFSYTMLFGKPQPDTDLMVYDAPPLLEQLLGEHTAELTAGGFDIALDIRCRTGHIQADAQHLYRIFANLFSNIRKYADPTTPVRIVAQWEGEMLVVELENKIRRESRLVESTKIGLRTCEKLLTAMGGSLTRQIAEETFSVRVVLPRATKD